MAGDCCVFKFLWRSVDGKHLMRFQSEISVFIPPAQSGRGINKDNQTYLTLNLWNFFAGWNTPDLNCVV